MREQIRELIDRLRQAPGRDGLSVPVSPARARQLRELEERLNHRFRNLGLLERALTHKSYVHEWQSEPAKAEIHSYEALEFLGDSILNLVMSEFLFHSYPKRDEGELSKIRSFLVSTEQLYQLSLQLNLGTYLLLSQGEEKTGGRHKKAILADVFESVTAALYLDGGMATARAFILARFQPQLERLDREELEVKDSKSRLQEHLHQLGFAEPRYEVVSERGPDHEKEFVIQVKINDTPLARGRGRSKREAEQQAAFLALAELLENLGEPVPVDDKGHDVE